MRLAEKALLQDIEVQRRGVCAALTARSKLTSVKERNDERREFEGTGIISTLHKCSSLTLFLTSQQLLLLHNSSFLSQPHLIPEKAEKPGQSTLEADFGEPQIAA